MGESIRPRRGHLRRRDWSPVSHGLYKPAGAPAGTPQDLEAWQLVLPEGAAFTHLTAARQLGWWLPPLPEDLPVFAAVPHAGTRPRRPGLIACRHPREIERMGDVELPLTIPEETLLACARDLGLLDLLVLTDAALHLGSCTAEDIERAASTQRRGAPRLREVLAMADGRAESAWEVLLFVLHHICDVPVEPQVEVRDEGGAFVARGDLHIRGTWTLHEYDGGEHRKKGRQRKDLARERRIGDTPWVRRGYTDQEVLHQSVGILRDADRSLGREHRPERIRAWYVLLAESLFTPAGTAKLRRRWGLPAEHAVNGSQTA